MTTIIPSIVINIDAACKGNPGASGAGVIIRKLNDNNELIHLDSICRNLGHRTNNQAEYMGLILALEWCFTNQYNCNIEIQSDSLLIVNQMTGKFAVKSPNVVNYFCYAKALVDRIPGTVTFKHIKRELNADADSLANEGVKCSTMFNI